MRFLLSLFLIACFSLLHAQVKPDFKSQAIAILDTYANSFQTIGSTTASPQDIKKARADLRQTVTSANIYVPNDFSAEAKDSMMTLGQYVVYLESNFPAGYKMLLNTKAIEYEDIKVNEKRNSYEVKATLKKRFDYPEITIKSDTSIIDSVETIVSTSDTIWIKKITSLTFYFTTSIEFGNYKPLLLEAIQIEKKMPQYIDELSELTQWWVSLDKGWKQKFSEQLKFPEVPTDYYLKRIHNIDKIDLSGINVKNLNVISQLKGLRELDLSGIELDTLIMLKGLKSLQTLNISKNKLRSLHGLEECTSLEVLNFTGNEITDLTPIANCTKLMALMFNENRIEDISIIKNFPHLLTLYMGSNDIKDISVLKNIRGIKKLDISKNKNIESIQPISHLIMMEKLDMYNTQAGTLAPLQNMVNMYHLDAGFCNLSSLDPIKNLENLNYLNISGNPIQDFSALNRFSNMRKLYLSAVKISDISPIMKMEKITVLYAPDSGFSKEDIQKFKKKYPKCQITYW